MEHSLVCHIIAEGVVERVVLGVEIADRPVEVQAAASTGEVPPDQRAAFEFDPVDIGIARVGGYADEGVADAVAVGIDTDRARDLDIGVVALENGECEKQPVFEQLAFQPSS